VTYPPAGYPPPPPVFSRPFGVILLGILNTLGALLYFGVGALFLIVTIVEPEQTDEGRIVLFVLGGVLVLVGAFHALTATGLFLLKGFGRVCQMIQSGIGLLAIPFGTIVSALILYYLTRPGVVLLFSGRPPAAMTPDERARVANDSNRAVAMAIVAIIGLFGGVAMIGIIAAIAIPGLLRARMAGNEASAIGSIRAMSSAQAAFAATHEGRYGTLECLTVPSSCPNADGTVATSPFITGAAAEPGPRSGYTFQLLLSPDQTRFVYWAEPAQAGQSGTRAFCVTETSTVQEYLDYQFRGQSAPPDTEQGCPAGGRTL
jgi:type II secretory pathway pseudopilin PulG